MAANILRLVNDPALRLKLAQDGHDFIQQFTWDKAGAAFEAAPAQLLIRNTRSKHLRRQLSRARCRLKEKP